MHGNEAPLAIAHLYMGVEAITRAVIRHECSKRGAEEEELGIALGLDPSDAKSGNALEAATRRRLIFKDDDATYKDGRRMSDGLEHGFASWEDIWSLPIEELLPKVARYLRDAILSVLGLPPEVYTKLTSQPFAGFVAAGPRIAYVSKANVSNIDLRATDFRIARVRRVMTASNFDPARGEYVYEYTLSP